MSIEQSTTSVEFREIERFPGYRFGDDGTAWTRHDFHHGLSDTWRPLLGSNHPRGYRRVEIWVDGKAHYCFLHRLVLEAFVGPQPPKCQACHNDGNTSNNKLSNLRWDTAKANQADRIKHGTAMFGVGHARAKLRDEDIPVIRQLCIDGKGCLEIGRMYGVNENAIRLIKKRVNWRHIP